jgi:hypothetical protein
VNAADSRAFKQARNQSKCPIDSDGLAVVLAMAASERGGDKSKSSQAKAISSIPSFSC